MPENENEELQQLCRAVDATVSIGLDVADSPMRALLAKLKSVLGEEPTVDVSASPSLCGPAPLDLSKSWSAPLVLEFPEDDGQHEWTRREDGTVSCCANSGNGVIVAWLLESQVDSLGAWLRRENTNEDVEILREAMHSIGSEYVELVPATQKAGK